MRNKVYSVYILASKKNGTLYIGITSDLKKRVWQHQNKIVKGFSQYYNVSFLVYFEQYSTSEEAIIREKYLKGKVRKYKISLIEKQNPLWQDLSDNSY